MNKMQQQVLEFHKTFKVDHPDTPQFLSDFRMKVRYRLIKEELEEFYDAYVALDIVEAADALGDMLFVVFRAATEMGIDLEPVFDEIFRSNMTKLGANGEPIVDKLGKILKGPNYEPPDLRKVMVL